ncbi:MAG: sulfur carrier protein ThiS [Acidobacteriota bacterium]|nr:sulfur carrier protein ThiS [Acidobacteriota bacterium]
MALQVILNGQQRSFEGLESGATVARLVEALGFREDRVAVEHNGSIVSRAQWPSVTLASDDRVEVVHFVGGGSR